MDNTRTNDSDNITENHDNTSETRPAPDAGRGGQKKTGTPDDAVIAPPPEIPDPDPETQLGSEPAAPGNMIPEDVPEIPWIKEDSDGEEKSEINLPGEKQPRREIGLPPKPQGPQVLKHDTTYRWTYGDQLRRMDNKRRSNTGVLNYAIILTIAFAICLTLLLGIALSDRNPDDGGADDAADTTNVAETNTLPGETNANQQIPGKDLSVSGVFDKVSPSVVGVTVTFGIYDYTSGGTGFILTADGYIATNYHVVENGQGFSVTTHDGTEYPAEYIGGDKLADLAVLKINATGLTPVQFGDSDKIKAGEPVVAIGYPVSMDYAQTVTDGIISSPKRDMKQYDDLGVLTKKMSMIQTNAAVNPGNSGGPLIDMQGRVIGIITLKLINDIEGMGFAIPINGARVILGEIIETGTSSSTSLIVSKRPLLGITAGGVVAGEQYDFDGVTGIPDISGVLIVSVSEGSGAFGKLQPGDIITQVDGRLVYYTAAISDLINKKYGGDIITVTFYRDGEYRTAEITLIEAE